MPLPATRCSEVLDDQQDSSSSEYDSLPEISVLDVYDLASEIGKEFEKMISLHGNEFVAGLMPKVIGVLELLEKTTSRQELERQTMDELRSNIALLEQEKREKALDRLRYEKEIEQLEENWKKESQELLAMISRLQEDNKKLSSSLKERELVTSKSPVNRELDWELFEKLRETNEKQRELLRIKDKDYQDKLGEAETLHSQLERLMESNKELRRKHNHVSQQMRTLVEERADLQAALQEQARSVTVLNKRLGLVQRDNEDLVQSQNDATDYKNKVLIDMNDPNRPRFTVTELKDILCERNELKARVSDLMDELSLYRPNHNHSSGTAPSKGSVTPCGDRDTSPATPPPAPEPEEPAADLPVQGPLPYEPDDAPWKRSTSKKPDSNIRKLFNRISSFPRFLAPRTVDGF